MKLVQFYAYQRDGDVLRRIIVTKAHKTLVDRTNVTYQTEREADEDMRRLNCSTSQA